MQESKVLTGRPDSDRLELVTNSAGVIISARLTDSSPLAYLLRIGLADHGHEASANTYLDWRQAYLATRGFKISNYGTRMNSGTGDDDKAGKYLKVIRTLGKSRQDLLHSAIDQQSRMQERMVYVYRDQFLDALNALGKAIHDAK